MPSSIICLVSELEQEKYKIGSLKRMGKKKVFHLLWYLMRLVLKGCGLSKDETIGEEIFFISVILNLLRNFFMSEELVKQRY